MNRTQCVTQGCRGMARNKGRATNGTAKYGQECHKCHRKANVGRKNEISNPSCEMCGWDKAKCDRHRIIPEMGYKPGNVRILCPNCHRLVTLGIVGLS